MEGILVMRIQARRSVAYDLVMLLERDVKLKPPKLILVSETVQTCSMVIIGKTRARIIGV